MKNETVTLSRQLLERIVNGGNILDSAEAMFELRAALADPVPPAGGEVEVFEPHGGTQTDGPAINAFTREFDIAEEWAMAGHGTVELLNREHVDAEVDRLRGEYQAIVTRLQAEVARKTHVYQVKRAELTEERAKNAALQSELTKARELIAATFEHSHRLPLELEARICEYRYHQSAPAAKDDAP